MSGPQAPVKRRRIPAHPVTLIDALIFAGGAFAAIVVGALAAAPPI